MKNAVNGEFSWQSWSTGCADLTFIIDWPMYEVIRIPILNEAELTHGVRARLSRNIANKVLRS